jgi:hypothetical protein
MVIPLVPSTPNFSEGAERSIGFSSWLFDFDALPAGDTVVLRLTGEYLSAGGAANVATYHLRLGAYADTDESGLVGTSSIILSVEANGAEGDLHGAVAIARPTGLHWLTLTGETSVFSSNIRGGLVGVEVVSSATDNTIVVAENDDFNNYPSGEELHKEHTVDFDVLSGANVTITFATSLGWQTSPQGTIRLRLDGTRGLPDGTEIMAITSTDFLGVGMAVDWNNTPILHETFTMARPSGVHNLKFTNEDGVGGAVRLRSSLVIIRGSA